jgi:predicted metalloprotease with PDZ domain
MKKLTVLVLGIALIITAQAQKMSYRMSFPNAIHHEAVIQLTASNIPLKPAIFRMSRSSPGRYATHEFGKNVYDVTATDKNGKAIAVNRIDGDVYEVPKHDGTVTIKYTLYGNYADGTYAGIDPESIHLNMPATFMWMKGMDNAPIEISFELPKENKAVYATQLAPTGKPNTFTAPGLQYFMDSPTKIGDLQIRQWKISNPDGKSFDMRIALEADATAAQFDELAGKIKKMVEEARAVFGEFPNYDYGSYTFIASANPYVYGDGMEHRNSTMISTTMTGFNVDRLLGVFSHEYFHNWNVERIRPKTLEPFNFEKSNISNELWCAEGFTQYYGTLLESRAGLITPDNYLQGVTFLVYTKQNTPGAQFYSPIQASNHAVFVDAGVSVDKTNYPNMFTSYYTYGAAIALALDLSLQVKYHKTLDAFMTGMWKRFGKTETPYTVAGMQEVLASITDAGFAADFFSKYVYGHEPFDYAPYLAAAGYDLKKSAEGKASIGLNVRSDNGKLLVASNTVRGSTAYEAGIDINDEILKLDNTEIKSNTDLTNFVGTRKPGDQVAITYRHRNKEKTATATLKEQTFPALVSFEQGGKTVTADMQAIRKTWFNSQVK